MAFFNSELFETKPELFKGNLLSIACTCPGINKLFPRELLFKFTNELRNRIK